MKRTVALGYGLLAYAVFFVTLLYLIGFVGNVGVPKGIDSGGAAPLAEALLINIGLVALFAIQHTIMARTTFKRWWTRIVPEPAERSTFVLITCAILALLFWQWRPIDAVIWHVEAEWARIALHAIALGGFGIVLWSTFLIDHFDLFGLRQVYLYLRGREYTPVEFRMVSLYKWVRHPLMLGFIIAFWATPDMTMGHLLFAMVTTAYIFVGIHFEERSLVEAHGDGYRTYRGSVSMLVPMPRRQKKVVLPARAESET